MARLHVSRVKGSEERGLIFSKAKAPQPDREVNFGAPDSGLPDIIVLSGEGVQVVQRGPCTGCSVSISVCQNSARVCPSADQCQGTI